MFYCNICGDETRILETSHSLDIHGHRTGKILRTCPSCHKDYHAARDDWVKWGRKGYETRKKKGYMPATFMRKGFPDPTSRRKR